MRFETIPCKGVLQIKWRGEKGPLFGWLFAKRQTFIVATGLESHYLCAGLKSVPQIHVHPEPACVTSPGSGVSAT